MALLQKVRLVEEFDADKNGKLDVTERAKARKSIRERRRALGFRAAATPQLVGAKPGAPIMPNSVTRYPKRRLYDQTILRTMFLYLPQEDWYGELSDFWRTDVELSGSLLVDNQTLKGVGVRFRGTSSYLLALRSPKKSFNLSLGSTTKTQRLGGHRTLNLLNGAGDSSLMREVLFSRICQEFVPTLRANFVRLVINGDDWGVFTNAQQFNSDFLADAFGSRKGVRWKVLRNSGGAGALTYLGEEPDNYKAYELKTTTDKEALTRLIRLCRVLNETPAKELPGALRHLLDIDGTLWFLALENVFMDTDGYLRQGYDYRLVEDKRGRFHPIHYDGNEAMRAASATPQAIALARRRGQIVLDTKVSPLAQADNPERPLVHRLLAVPQWRARYLAHVRTLATEWLDWQRIGAVAQQYHDLIDKVVAGDERRGTSYEAFGKSLEQDFGKGRRMVRSVKGILAERRQHLLAHEALTKPWPQIHVVEATPLPATNGARAVRVIARVTAKTPVEQMLLYTTTKKNRPYTATMMWSLGDGAWTANTAALAPGTKLRFYVEARTKAATGTTEFHPAAAEAGPLKLRITAQAR